MNATWTHRDYGFAIGLLTGACVGAGLTIWLDPRLASALRQRAFDSVERSATAVHSGRVIAGGTHYRADRQASTLRAL